MTGKTAYIWGPVSSFTGPLAAWLVKKGWQVDIACKSSLNLFTLSPLDLRSTAEAAVEKAFGGRNKAKAFKDKYRIVDQSEIEKGTNYSAIIFAGMPPNFDESRAPRAPWSATELKDIIKRNKEVPTFVISSIYGGVQPDGVVPELVEFDRRKPITNWESICQQYEHRLLESLSACESPWYLVRLPLMMGSTEDGTTLNYTGLYLLLKRLDVLLSGEENLENLEISFNPDSTLWFLPVDTSVYVFWRFLEDEKRPRILNLVPTNSCLNREWLMHAARSMGADELVKTDDDQLALPNILVELLADDVQVTTRNLFEVQGRYHVPPLKSDRDYFDRVITQARKDKWGGLTIGEPTLVPYSDSLAKYYFEEFLPELLNTGSFLDKAIQTGKEIGFMLKETGDLAWVLSTSNGESVLEPLNKSGSTSKPKICYRLSGKTLVRLIQKQRMLPLHRALLLRQVEVEGPILETMKVTNLMERFLKENPLTSEQLKQATT